MNKLENNHYSLCLNMIVKNESHIIRNTLEKLLKKIKFDYWVISDTGSTDNTKEIILDFFKEVNICGEIFDDEWKGFGHNRTKALEHAFKKSKYLLVFDADDELCGDFVLPELVLDSYHFQFGDASGTSYTRTQIINNQKKWKYFGVLHEFIGCMEPTNGTNIIRGNYYTVSGKSGNRSKDSNKYLKDAKILEEAYDEAVNNNDAIYNRYGFYCANSYYDCGKYEDAIKWYKKTLESGCWCQEKYVSCLRIYNCYKCLKEQETGFFYLVKSAEYDKERVECFYELIQHYCSSGLNENAYVYYTVIKPFYDKYLTAGLENKLFIDCSKANFFLPYYMIIVAHNVKDYDTGLYMFRIIFTKKHKEFGKFFVGNMLFNLQFFTEQIKSEDLDEFKTLFKGYIDFLLANNYPLYDHDFMNNYEKFGIIVPKFEPEFSRRECSKSKKILIYTGFMYFLWNDTYVSNNSIGGAEKAVAYVTRYFPKDYEIIVSGDVADEVVGNITYINRSKLQDLLDREKFHTIIVSRYISFFSMFKGFKFYQLFLSAHDSSGFINNVTQESINSIIENNNKYIDGVICLTNWHKSNIVERHPCLKDKISIINNGILEKFFENCYVKNGKFEKIKNKFVWTSCSYRGLHVILNLWGDILKHMPDATLDISSYEDFPKNDQDKEMLQIINKYDSITHHGKLNTVELYDLIIKAEYWLYTNTFPETSCITALEMLMCEVICLYYPLAGLLDTLGKYGIQVSCGNEIETIMNLSEEKKVELKKKGKEYALSCSWENRAKEWSAVLGLNNQRIYDLHNNYTIPQNHINYLKKLKEEFRPKIIYDIGANVLNWTKEAKKVWTDADIIVFDAIKTAEFLYKQHNYKYHVGVLSDIDDKIVKFYDNAEHPAGNSYYKEIGHPKSSELYPENKFTEQRSSTLSTVVKNNNFPLPDLIKFDVQGCELDIIKGSIDIINHAKYLIAELQIVEYNKGAPLADKTIKFLEDNGWELLTKTPFCDNGPDGDYCFKNNRIKNKMKWVFYPGNYNYIPIVQYLENFSSSEIDIEISNDINYINNIKPDRVTILLTPFGYGLLDKNILNILNNIDISFLQLEPLNLPCRLNEIVSEFKNFPVLKKYPVYDYSKTNIKILNNNGINNCIHLPYKCVPAELNLLKKCHNSNKEYDFALIYDWKGNGGVQNLPTTTPRRNKVLQFLIDNGYSINIVAGYGEDRDTELGKCKIILNIHGQVNINPTPAPDECSNIFEHIRCDRLLEAGFTILSETSYELDPDFINKYPNLKIINYNDFFNLDIIKQFVTSQHSSTLNLVNEQTKVEKIKQIFDTLCRNENPFRYYLNPIDIYEHLPTLYKYGLECNSILECGVRGCVSSWAFLYGLLNNNSTNNRLILNDITPCDISDFLECTQNISGINVSYQWISDLDITLNENVDLTFIDTWHVGGHLKKELEKFGKLTNKYIIMHDTTVDEFTSEAIRANLTEEEIKKLSIDSGLSVNDIKMGLWQAIEFFLNSNSDWVLHERYTNNNGLTILRRRSLLVETHIFGNKLYPINFSIPKEKITENKNVKTKILSNLVPGEINTYNYNTEEEYYNEYKQSYFAVTKQKAGWDCLRHYEILANGCIPYFVDIEKCPKNTMTLLPKELFIESNILFNKFQNKNNINELTEGEKLEYYILQTKLLEYTKNFLTTDKLAEYILQNANYRNVKKILYLSGNTEPDYLRCLTLHGFKQLDGIVCHDYPKVPHIYKTDNINYKNLYGKGFTYSNLLDPILHDDNLDNTIIEDIRNKYYDIIIYGSYHRGMPYYSLILEIYKPDEIILLCGEDIHCCDYANYLNRGHFVFVREE